MLVASVLSCNMEMRIKTSCLSFSVCVNIQKSERKKVPEFLFKNEGFMSATAFFHIAISVYQMNDDDELSTEHINVKSNEIISKWICIHQTHSFQKKNEKTNHVCYVWNSILKLN